MNLASRFSSTPEDDPGPGSLAELEARLKRDFALLTEPPAKDWLAPTIHPGYGPVLDVAIIGAGMAGLSAAFALKRLGIRRMRLFDRAPEGSEGPWASYARMETLRSPKELVGPALGLPNLTFRAWFEAQFGREAWDAVYRIPRLQWMDYLRWYRRMLDVPVENETELVDLAGDGDLVLLTLRSGAGEKKVAARRLILANGRDGLGGPAIPEIFRTFDRKLWNHTRDEIDFEALRGKDIAVIGAGSSAADNAAQALETGAGRVAMLIRRPDIPRINKGMGITSPGMSLGFASLKLEERWSILQYIADQSVPPPHNSMLRCSRHRNFSVIARCAVRAVSREDGKAVLDTTRGRLAFDHVILGTGFTLDWQARPELRAIAPYALRWRDRFTPEGQPDYAQGDHPFVGPAFEFLQKNPGSAPWIERVHCFTFAATLNHGPISGDIPGISVGAQRVADGVASALFAEDYEETWRRLVGHDKPELLGDEWMLDEDVGAFFAPAPSEETKA